MGNKQSLNPQIPQINSSEWEQGEEGQTSHPIFGEYTTLRHVQTGDLIDEYILMFTDQEDFKLYLDAFIWRLREPNIVRTLYLKENHRQQFCSKTYGVKVYIESIKTRLSDITDIPFPQNLYVADCVLDGYHKLYDHLHYFKVEESQICVDSEGLVRVWLNGDLSKNYPTAQNEEQGADQTLMVEQILTILEDNTDKESQPVPLSDYFRRHSDRAVGFEQAKMILNEYIRQHNVEMPLCFESILEINRNNQQLDEEDEDDALEHRINNMSNHRLGGPQSRVSHDPQPHSRLIQLSTNMVTSHHPAADQQFSHTQLQIPAPSIHIHGSFAHPMQVPGSHPKHHSDRLMNPFNPEGRPGFIYIPNNFNRRFSPVGNQIRTSINRVSNLPVVYNESHLRVNHFARNPPSFALSSRENIPHIHINQRVTKPMSTHYHHQPAPAPAVVIRSVSYSPRRQQFQQRPPYPNNRPVLNSINNRAVPQYQQQRIVPNYPNRNQPVWQYEYHQETARSNAHPEPAIRHYSLDSYRSSQRQLPPRQTTYIPIKKPSSHPQHQIINQTINHQIVGSKKSIQAYSNQKNVGFQDNQQSSPVLKTLHSQQDKKLKTHQILIRENKKGKEEHQSINNSNESVGNKRANRFAVNADQEIREVYQQHNDHSRQNRSQSQSRSHSQRRRTNEQMPRTMLSNSIKNNEGVNVMGSSSSGPRSYAEHIRSQQHSTHNPRKMQTKDSIIELEKRIYHETGFKASGSLLMKEEDLHYKAYYYTLETAEQLDPEIAADLKRYTSFH